MEFTTRAATMADLEDLCAIERSAIPGYEYMYDNRHFFFEEAPGEMVLAVAENGEAAGMGRYSILPDGSGWLEILRVKKEYQNMGAGKAIYRRYMQLAKETNAPSVAMFTGRSNLASKGLAERNGFHLAAAYLGGDLALEGRSAPCADFAEVTDPTQAAALIAPHVEGWGPFLVLNRTFFHYGEPLYRYLCEQHMVYGSGTEVVVLGARMLRERGLHLGMFGGDTEKCLSFAADKAAALGAKKLSVMYPPRREDIREATLAAGYEDSGELIVMEWTRS